MRCHDCGRHLTPGERWLCEWCEAFPESNEDIYEGYTRGSHIFIDEAKGDMSVMQKNCEGPGSRSRSPYRRG